MHGREAVVMLLIFATPEEGRELLGLSTRPQTSGPCVHYGPYGCEVPREDGQCPHLDNASIVCPIKDVLGAATGKPLPDFAGDQVPVTQCDEAAIRRPRFKAGDKVQISHPTYKGYTGTIRRYDAATANYLTHIDGTSDTMWLSEDYLEAV
jgi:hypothetical protein